MKRIICLILCVLMISTVLVSCSNEETPDTSVNSAPTTDNGLGICEVPETDEWQGKEFRCFKNSITTTDVFSEGVNGEVINDAVFKRNQMVGDKYGVTIVLGEANSFSNVVSSGEDAFELYGEKYAGMNEAILNGLCVDIEKLTYMSPEKPWWNTQLIDSFEICGKKVVFSGDFSQRIMDWTWAIGVNKGLAQENKLDDIYQTVRDGKWTLETMRQNCANITSDLDGDGVFNHNDRWGFLSSNNVATALMTASNVKTVERNNNGSLKFSLSSQANLEKLQEIWEFSTDTSFQLKAEQINTGSSYWDEAFKIFDNGRALYQARVMQNFIASLKTTNMDYAIVPMPKYDEEQDNYTSTFQAHSAGTYVVPKTVSDFEFVSAVLEYMCYCSTNTIRTTYYDNVLQGRAAQDYESVEMLDLVFATATTDIGLHLGIAGLRDVCDSLLNNPTNVLSSSISACATPVNAEIQKFETAVKRLD